MVATNIEIETRVQRVDKDASRYVVAIAAQTEGPLHAGAVIANDGGVMLEGRCFEFICECALIYNTGCQVATEVGISRRALDAAREAQPFTIVCTTIQARAFIRHHVDEPNDVICVGEYDRLALAADRLAHLTLQALRGNLPLEALKAEAVSIAAQALLPYQAA